MNKLNQQIKERPFCRKIDKITHQKKDVLGNHHSMHSMGRTMHLYLDFAEPLRIVLKGGLPMDIYPKRIFI